MGRIFMPPRNLHKERFGIVTYCQPFLNDPLEIVVTSNGEFLCLPEGYFSPNLPIGFVAAGAVLPPYNPVVNDRDVLMVFLDNESLKTYVTKIEIRTTCLDAAKLE